MTQDQPEDDRPRGDDDEGHDVAGAFSPPAPSGRASRSPLMIGLLVTAVAVVVVLVVGLTVL